MEENNTFNEKPSWLDKFKYSKLKFVAPVVILLVVVIVVILVVKLTRTENYEDDYFVSDGSKLVVAMDKSIASYEEGRYEPDITYVLYYYKGDKVEGMKVFFAYDTEAEAERADANIPLDDKTWATSKTLKGRYLVFDAASDQFDGLTISYVKKIIEDMEAAGTMYEPDKDTQDDVINTDGN